MSNRIIEQYKSKHNLTDKDIQNMKEIDPSAQHEGTLLTGYKSFERSLLMSKDKVITIYPDYDADGVCSGIVAYSSLKALGFDEVNLVKPKTTDGYGLNFDVVMKQFPETEVILTTDNGIKAKFEVDKAQSFGVDVIITDHHLGEQDYLPKSALAIVNPNRSDKEETYPFKAISGTAVIYKLMVSFAFRQSDDEDVYRAIQSLYPLVGISTISDVMPPLDENRYFMKATLQYLKSGIYEKTISSDINHVHDMLNLFVSCLEDKYFKRYEATLDLIGFRIAPILNSPRRMLDDSELAFNLFLIDSEANLPMIICLNDERKALVKSIIRAIEVDSNQSCVILQDDNIPHGVAGLIASHLVREYEMPAFVLCKDNAGSARAPEGMSVYDGLKYIHDTNPEILFSWGGHSVAAGVKVEHNMLDDFVAILNHFYSDKKAQRSRRHYLEINVDNKDEIEDALSAIHIFEDMQPFEKHKIPLYQLDFDTSKVSHQIMKDLHLKFNLSQDVNMIDWNGAQKFHENNHIGRDRVNAVCSAQENNFRGYKSLQFIANDISYS